MTQMTLRIPDDLDHDLTALAARQYPSKNAAILALITEGIERAQQVDADHDDALIAEILAIGGPDREVTGAQIAADIEAMRNERLAATLGEL